MTNDDTKPITEEKNEVASKRRCLGFSVKKQARCEKKRRLGSKYCWHHQPWGGISITLIGGLALGFFTNIITNRITERKPELVAFLNHEPLSEDVVLCYPSNSGTQAFSLFIKNSGDLAASDMFAMMYITKKTKLVDITLAIDALRHTHSNHVDRIVLYSGDGDYVPLVKEIMRAGKQVVVGALSSGLNPEMRLVADQFIDLDEWFFLPG